MVAPRSAFYVVILRQNGFAQCTSRAVGQFCNKHHWLYIKSWWAPAPAPLIGPPNFVSGRPCGGFVRSFFYQKTLPKTKKASEDLTRPCPEGRRILCANMNRGLLPISLRREGGAVGGLDREGHFRVDLLDQWHTEQDWYS